MYNNTWFTKIQDCTHFKQMLSGKEEPYYNSQKPAIKQNEQYPTIQQE